MAKNQTNMFHIKGETELQINVSQPLSDCGSFISYEEETPIL